MPLSESSENVDEIIWKLNLYDGRQWDNYTYHLNHKLVDVLNNLVSVFTWAHNQEESYAGMVGRCGLSKLCKIASNWWNIFFPRWFSAREHSIRGCQAQKANLQSRFLQREEWMLFDGFAPSTLCKIHLMITFFGGRWHIVFITLSIWLPMYY